MKKTTNIVPASKNWISNWPSLSIYEPPAGFNGPVCIVGGAKTLPRLFDYAAKKFPKELGKLGFAVKAYAGSETKDPLVLHAGKSQKIAVLKSKGRTLGAKRKALSAVIKAVRKAGNLEAFLVLEDKSWTPALDAALSELYDYDCFRQRDVKKDLYHPRTLFLRIPGLERGDVLVLNQLMWNVFFARDLVNRPPEAKPPRLIAETVQRYLAGVSQHVRTSLLFDGNEDFEKMGLVKAVGAGSIDEQSQPTVLVAEYRHPNARNKKPVALIGKGVCFDTGGYQVKTGDGMPSMKMDMAGAATVFGVLRAAAQINLPINLVAVAPFVYNHISSRAYMPDGVYVSYSGKTVEIGHTDAEGRLILADVLSYAEKKFEPELMIDAATLTGACCVALGLEMAGIFVDPKRIHTDPILKLFLEAGRKTGELYWPLPLYEPYFEKMKSPVGNMKNVGDKYGGAITAALFLKQFVNGTPWYHLDIAGPAIPEGKLASGFGVRSILEVLKNYVKSK